MEKSAESERAAFHSDEETFQRDAVWLMAVPNR